MKALVLGIAAATIAGGIALAQNAGGDQGAQAAPNDGSHMNAAVNTSGQNLSKTPVRGANSFTQSEARRRIEAHGFTAVSDLRKDNDGIWRGMAQKDGQKTGVWLDYQGNVGQQQ